MRERIERGIGISEIPEPVWDQVEASGLLGDSEEAVAEEVVRLLFFAEEMRLLSTNETAESSGLGDTFGSQVRSATARGERFGRDKMMERKKKWDHSSDVRKHFIEKSLPDDEDLLSPEIAQGFESQDVRDPVMNRSRVFSLYLSKLAATREPVKEFRRRVWQSEDPPSNEQARGFLESPAAAVFPLTWFEERGIPPLAHSSESLPVEEAHPTRPMQSKGKLSIWWNGGSLEQEFEGLRYPYPSSFVRNNRVPVLCNSALATLYEVAAQLRREIPWNEGSGSDESESFVLWGETPWVEPLRAFIREESVDLSVVSWVPVSEVYDLYDDIRKELNPSQVTAPRRLRLVEFVLEHPGVTLQPNSEVSVPTWRKLQGDWNERYPEGHDWHYTDSRNFRRAFNESLGQLRNVLSR